MSHFGYRDRAEGKGDDQMKQRWYVKNGDALCRIDLREAAMGLGTRSWLRAIYG